MKTKLTCFAALFALTCIGAPDLTKLPPPAKKEGVTYSTDIKPILQSTCFRCHGEQRQRGGLRLDSLEAVLKGGEDGKVILPGKSAESPLVLAVARVDEKTAMPPRGRGGPGKSDAGKNQKQPSGDTSPNGPRGPGGPPAKALTAEQVGLIRAWVDQGAK